MDDATVKQIKEAEAILEGLCSAVTEQRAVVAEKSAAKRVEETKLEELEAQVMEAFEKLDKRNFKSERAHAQFALSYRSSVKIPALPENKQKFFDYLKARGVFEDMIGVNSNTLNRFYKDEFDAAKARNDFDFEIPGLEAPTLTPILSVTKLK